MHSVEEFCKLWSYWLPARGAFLGSFKGGGKYNSLLWQHGPVEFERRWEAFQRVVQQIWRAAGGDSAKIMMTLASRYKKQAEKRQSLLRCWETSHMRKNDKRPASSVHLKAVGSNLKAAAWLVYVVTCKAWSKT